MENPETVLHRWADRTRRDARDLILADHLPDARIFDVLGPVEHATPAAYAATWDDWMPDTAGDAVFDFEDLRVTEAEGLAFAHALIRCGGTTPDGREFRDLVRATFGLVRGPEGWRIAHHHISKPQ
ncbi:MAG: nuclear transport factor 2 family protein [Paracoccaceae bacterium]|nr:MAG: nuclear transport factor 2 family protein [Paracoccaceae bacterium]